MFGTKRGDIQGLRALAVILVVAYHAGVPFISGGFVGVDMFFVLSGFLITGLLIHEVETHGKVSLRQFWARRARRLIPASALVLITTLVAMTMYAPILIRKAVSLDVLWASLFSANWRFAQQGTDYGAADRDPSPVLHYWSLGVEEQFYMVWPVLIVAFALIVKLSHRPHLLRPALTVAFATVLIASLAYSVHLSAVDQPYAFFGTPTRAWQFAAGALAACAVPAFRKIRGVLRDALSWTGLGMLVAAVCLFTEGTTIGGYPYPSWIAGAPTLATVMLLASGTGRTGSFAHLMSATPLQKVGDISYSLYLWHWPVLVGGAWVLGTTPTPAQTGALMVLAVGLSVVTYLIVENPIRRAKVLIRRPALSMALGVGLMMSVVPAIQATANVTSINTITVTTPTSTHVRTVTPALGDAFTDEPVFKALGCQLEFDGDAVPDRKKCTVGNKASAKRVVLLGDSIGTAIAPAVEGAATEHGWALTVWGKARCSFATDTLLYDFDYARPYEKCASFRENVLTQVTADKPDLVIIAMSHGSIATLMVDGKKIGGTEADTLAIAGLEKTVHRLKAAGINVALVQTPNRAKTSPTSCLAEERDTATCGFPVNTAAPITKIAAQNTQTPFVRINDQVCPDQKTCQPVVGNKVVYRDSVHYTETFAASLVPEFEPLFK